MEQMLQQKIFPYDGSLDTTKHPLLIRPSDIIDADNIVYTTYSTKKLRPGITQAFESRPAGSSRILGGVDFWRLGSQYFVYFDGTRVKAISPGGIVDDITGDIDLPTNETVSFVKFSGLLIIFFSGGGTIPKKWTGTGLISDLSDDVPFSTMGRVFLNALWVDDPSIQGRVLKSVTGDPTDFTTGDAQTFDIDINDGDPDGITAIFPVYYEKLYIAKRFSIFRISPVILSDGSVAYSIAKFSDGVGCNSHNAAVAVESYIFFPSDRGIHALQNTDKISSADTDFVSINIQTVWKSDVNFRRAKFMQAVYDLDLNSYLLIFPSIGQNYPSDVFAFSIVAMKWYRWKSYNQTAIARWIDPSDRRIRTMVMSKDGDFGYIDQDSYFDYNKRYGAYIQSGIIAPSGAPDENYLFKAIAPIFAPQLSGFFNIAYTIDGRTIETLKFSMVTSETGDALAETFIPGESVLGGLQNLKFDKRTLMGKGSFYSFIIDYQPDSNSEDDEGFEILGMLFDMERVQKRIGEGVA